MATLALVIGVNAYPLVHQPLAGCVPDAIAMRRFLVDRGVVSPSDLRLLVSPVDPIADDPEAASAPPATSANVRAALADLAAAVAPGDHVILFFAGHGLRVSNRRTGERLYGFAPSDATPLGGGAYGNLILAPELNAALRAVRARGASVSVIADTCHSGGATRGVAVPRRLPEVTLGDEGWAAFLAAHPAIEAPRPARREVTRGGLEASAEGDEEWVIFSACVDSETAKEAVGPEPHGAFTRALLDVLGGVDPATVRAQRWADLIEPVKEAVAAAVRENDWDAQTPTLEGQAWTSVLAPAETKRTTGFAVTVQRDGTIAIDGGTLHGLDVGAEILIEPTEAVRSADPTVRAIIETAEAARSTARPIDPSADIFPNSRARLARPNATEGRMGVRLVDVPQAMAAAIFDVVDADAFLAVDPPDGRVEVEVRPWREEIPRWTDDPDKGNPWAGRRGGWVIVPFAADRGEPTPDDVIAYLPAIDAPYVAGDAPRVGRALGAGLIHWAQYLRLLRRGNDDPSLAGIFDVSLRMGATKEAALKRAPDASGTYVVSNGEPLWIALAVRWPTATRLFAGLVVFSDDGNVDVLWPTDGADPGIANETVYVGNGRFKPAKPVVRLDQQQSRYTFKVIAYTAQAGGPPRLGGLARPQTVQEVMVDVFMRGSVRGEPEPSPPRWHTWDLPVVVRR